MQGHLGHRLALPLTAFAAAALASFALSIARTSDVAWVDPPRASSGKWHPGVVRALSSGQTPTWVDALVLRFVTDPAYSHVAQGEHPAIFYDLDLATDLDPGFFGLLVNGAGILSVVRDDSDGALVLLNKGARYSMTELPSMPASFQTRVWGQAWSLFFMLGYVHLFEKHDLVAARDAFQKASELPESPPFLRQMVRRISEPGKLLENAIRIVDIRLSSLREESLRRPLLEHRRELETAMFLRDLNRAWRQDHAARTAEGLRRFLAARGLAGRDPLGGELQLDPKGRIGSTTRLSKAASMIEE